MQFPRVVIIVEDETVRPDVAVQLSVADAPARELNAEMVVAAKGSSPGHCSAIVFGAVTKGFMLSVTVTVWVAVALFPEPSVTVQVTVVLPKGKEVGALLVTEATEQLSAVVGVPRTTPVAVQAVFVVVATFDGAVMVGLMVSSTITV